MPIYQYQPVSRDCKRCEGVFEVHQRVADDRLEVCPTCGQAVERRISAPALGGKYSTSDAAVKAAGLTKYKKVGNGQYERTVGSGGPETLDRGSK